MKNENGWDEKKILHDIANALSPALHYPNRIKKMENVMEYGFRYIGQIHQELSSRGDRLPEYLRDDPRGQKMLPAIAELCKLGEENIQLLRTETGKLLQNLERMNGLVADLKADKK